MSNDVTPKLALTNLGNCHCFDAVQSSEPVKSRTSSIPSIFFVKFSNFSNLNFRKSRSSISFSFSVALSTLQIAICIIVTLASNEQVIRIATQFKIAAMAHADSLSYISVRCHKGHYVSADIAIIKTDLSVTTFPTHGSVPRPTLVFASSREPTPKLNPHCGRNFSIRQAFGVHQESEYSIFDSTSILEYA